MNYDEDDAIAYIKEHVPATKDIDGDQLLNLVDAIWDFYDSKGLLDIDPDTPEEEIDADIIYEGVIKALAKDKGCTIPIDLVPEIVQAELEYEVSLEEDDFE